EEYLAAWSGEHAGDGAQQLVAALAQAVLDCFGELREQSTVEFELYVAAARRPALRETADRCMALSVQAMERFTDAVTAAAVTSVMTGLILHGLAAPRPPSRAGVEAVLSRVLTPGRMRRSRKR